MKSAKNNFLVLLENIVDICNRVVKEVKIGSKVKKLSVYSLKVKLFEYSSCAVTSMAKMGISIPVDEINFSYLVENAINKNHQGAKDENLFKNPFELFYDSSVAKQMSMVNMEQLYKEIKNLYNIEKPCYWFNLENELKVLKEVNLFNFYIDACWYYLILLIVFKGLPYCLPEQTRSLEYPDLDEFKKILDNKKRILFKGDYRCGKTTFIKRFIKENFKNAFYIDSKGTKLEDTDVLYTLKPYVKFLCENTQVKRKYNNFLFFNLLKESDTENFYTNYFQDVDENFILIIDHISYGNLDTIKKLENLKCKIVFVVNENVDFFDHSIAEYFYDNTILLREILTNANCADIENGVFEKLRKDLGADVLLYKLIGKAHEVYEEKYNFNLIQNLYDANTFDQYDELFNKINSMKDKKISFNYGKNIDKKTSLYLDDHITNLYSETFKDNEKKTKKSNDRINQLQLYLIRLFCRLKNKGIPYSEIENFFNFFENKVNDIHINFQKLSWVKNDAICIPNIIAYAFNRKKIISKQQYKEELLIRDNIISYIVYWSRVPSNSKLYKALLSVFLEDMPYLQSRAKSIDNEYKKVIMNIVEENGTTKEILSKEGKRTTKIRSDAEEQSVALHLEYLLMFLEQTMIYAFWHNEKELWKKAKGVVLDEFPKKLICTLLETIDDELQFKNFMWKVEELFKYHLEPDSQYFIMEMHIFCICENILKFLKDQIENQSFAKLEQTELILKNLLYIDELYSIISHYEHHYCRDDTEGHKELLNFYKVLCKIYLNIHDFDKGANINLFIKQIRELRYNGKLQTRLCENFLVLICFAIVKISSSEELTAGHKNSIKGAFEDLKCFEKSAGDLPRNIREIVSITKNFLAEKDLLDDSFPVSV